ncbi:proteinase B [Entomophthora muscae]|uniref:Proteinase B n=1 Tax=Entomophthora muscae TaxID=34485 RepID=A0ACC2RLS2_9FUNG|nr:proteinase B [Entomophthora muscae]
MKSFVQISLISVLFQGGYLADATGSYIVTLRSLTEAKILDDHLARVQSEIDSAQHSREKNKINYEYRTVLKGYSAVFTDEVLAKVKAMSEVEDVEEDQGGSFAVIQKDAPWGLGRLSSPNLPLGNSQSLTYEYDHEPSAGEGVDVYVVDSGISTGVLDFEERANWGVNFVTDDEFDVNDHGTHVAGIVGSKTYGVAKKSTMIAVKVGDGKDPVLKSSLIAGVDWAVKDKKVGRGCVINISLALSLSKVLNRAAGNGVDLGCVVVAAAGNSNKDACNFSPASELKVITVGATDIKDVRADFSNWGKCVTLFAPGVDILSTTFYGFDHRSESGTSMAAPHVAGLAAIVLSKNKNYTPADVLKEIIEHATKHVKTKNGKESRDKLVSSKGL